MSHNTVVKPGNVFSQRRRASLYWIMKGVTEGYQTELTESWLLHAGAPSTCCVLQNCSGTSALQGNSNSSKFLSHNLAAYVDSDRVFKGKQRSR